MVNVEFRDPAAGTKHHDQMILEKKGFHFPVPGNHPSSRKTGPEFKAES